MMEEHVLVPKSVSSTREDLKEFGFTKRCPGCISMLRRTARQAHTEGCRRRAEAECSTKKREGIPGKSGREGEQNERSRVHREAQPRDGETVRTEEGITCSSNGKSSAAPAPGPDYSGGTSRMDKSGERRGPSGEDKKRKAEGEHSQNPQRADVRWMRMEGSERTTRKRAS